MLATVVLADILTHMDGIDYKKGIINVYSLLPETGDSLMIINHGTHFEIRQHSWTVHSAPPLHLTDDDLDRLRQGLITWN